MCSSQHLRRIWYIRINKGKRRREKGISVLRSNDSLRSDSMLINFKYSIEQLCKKKLVFSYVHFNTKFNLRRRRRRRSFSMLIRSDQEQCLNYIWKNYLDKIYKVTEVSRDRRSGFSGADNVNERMRKGGKGKKITHSTLATRNIHFTTDVASIESKNKILIFTG